MKLTLDIPAIDFDDTAFLSIRTDMPGYVLVDDLNHLYDLSLHRTDDVTTAGLDPIPLYRYHDPMCHLSYWMAELHDEGHLLIVRGSACREVVEKIENDFNSAVDEPHPADLPAVRRHAILTRYQQALTVVSIVDFSDDVIEAASQKKLPPKSQKVLHAHAAMADLFARILDFIDLNRLDEMD